MTIHKENTMKKGELESFHPLRWMHEVFILCIFHSVYNGKIT